MDTPGFPSVTKGLVARATSLPEENRGRGLVGTTWLLIAISVLVVLARVWAKLKHARRLFHDDALMILAVSSGIAHAIYVQLAVNNGYGSHLSHISMERLKKNVRFGAASILCGSLSAMLGRVAFCCTLLFLIKTDPRMRAWPVYLCIFLQIAINVTGIVIVFTQCGKDVNGLWDHTQGRYYDWCEDPALQTYMRFVVGAVNTATDLYLAILPAVLVNHTKMSTKAKLGLTSLLCLSILAMVASGAKTYEAKFLRGLTDYTWTLVPYTLCTSVELNIIIISASIPLLRPLFRRQEPPRRTLRGDTWPDGKHIALQSVTSSQQGQGGWRSDLKSDANESASERDSSDGIRVTTEIEVVYNSQSAPVIHASLMGLTPESNEFACSHSTDASSAPRRRWWGWPG